VNPSMRIAALVAVALCSTASAGSGKIQCWTDEHGQRACGNSVPAQYADKERSVLNERGQVVETKPHATTLEEINAPAAKAPQSDAKTSAAQTAAH